MSRSSTVVKSDVLGKGIRSVRDRDRGNVNVLSL